jgi:hypothetical protein
MSQSIRPTQRVRFLAAVGGAMLALSACRDHEVAAPGFDANEIVPIGAVQPIVVREPGTQAGESILTVRVHGMGIDVGAYQGVLTFDTSAVTVIRIEAPTIDGEFRVVNDEELASGRIRFAAFTAEKLSSDLAFRVTIRTPANWESAALRARLDVAGDVTGAAISESALRGTSAVYDSRTGAPLTP